MNSNTTQGVGLIVNHRSFSKILKKVAESFDTNEILDTESTEQVTSYVQTYKIKFLLIDNSLSFQNSFYDTAIVLIKELRRDFNIKAPVILFCYNRKELLSDPNNMILNRKGQCLLEIPFSLSDLKNSIKQTRTLSDADLEKTSIEDCTTLGIINKIAEEIIETISVNHLTPKNAQETSIKCQKGYENLIFMLSQHLPGYFHLQEQKKMKKEIEQITSSTFDVKEYKQTSTKVRQQIETLIQNDKLSKALRIEAFSSLFHSSIYDIRNSFYPLSLAISDYISGWSGVDRVVQAIKEDKWWIPIENELSIIKQKLLAALGDKSKYLEDFLDIQTAFQKFKEYVEYIEHLEEQKEIIASDRLKKRSEEALLALGNIGDGIDKIEMEYNRLKKRK